MDRNHRPPPRHWLIRPTRLAAAAGVVAVIATLGAQTHTIAATGDRGSSQAPTLANTSGDSAGFGSVFPQVAVSPVNGNVVAVARRPYRLPVDTNAPKDARTAECQVSVSRDAAQTFSGTDTIPFFRANPAAAAIGPYYCNAQFATGTDHGATFAAHLIAQANEFDTQGTTRYPVAADPRNAGHFAVVADAPDHKSVAVSSTKSAGQSWNSASPGPAPGTTIVNTNQTSTGYTADGRHLMVWCGFHRDQGAFDTHAATLDEHSFGVTLKISPERCVYQPMTYLGNYGAGNGAGDLTTWTTGNRHYAFVAFPYSPDAIVQDTHLARIPLASLG